MHYGQVQTHHFVHVSIIAQNYGHLKSTRPVASGGAHTLLVAYISEEVGQGMGVVYWVFQELGVLMDNILC